MHSPPRSSFRVFVFRSEERGSVILLVTVFAFLIAGLSFGLLLEARADLVAVDHHQSSMEALQVAEVGLVKAQMEISSLSDADGDGIGNVSGAFAGGGFAVQAAEHPSLDGRWVLTARGTKGHSARRIEVGVRRRDRTKWVEGIYGKEGLDFGGQSRTDAYDSRNGSYTSQAVNSDAGGTYAQKGGHLGSGGDIVLHGASTIVRGNAIPGWAHQVQGLENATVTGDTMARRIPIDVPDPSLADFQAALTVNDNASILGALGKNAIEANVNSIHSKNVGGLTELQVDGLAQTDLMLMDESQVGATTFGDLLADSYTTLVGVAETDLAVLTGQDYSHVTGYGLPPGGEVEAEWDDGVVVVEAEYGESEFTFVTSSTSYGSGATEKPPGRISYDDTTKDLRATAGAEVVLDGGTYFFRNLTTVGNARIVVRGPSKVYVTGELNLGGGSIVNQTGFAGDLQVFVHPYALPGATPPTRSRVKIRGGSDVAAAIYAPGVDATIGGGDHFYGSLVGRNVSVLGNVAFHYDKALSDLDPKKRAVLERLYWRELSSP